MTIRQAVLDTFNNTHVQLSMNEIDTKIFHQFPTSARNTIRARVYELMNEGKLQRVGRGIYRLAVN